MTQTKKQQAKKPQAKRTNPVVSDSSLTVAHIVYCLQLLAVFAGITAIIAVIISYVKIDDTRGTWLESHYQWQIKTFWRGLIFIIISILTWVFIIGMVLMAITFIWYLYRIIKGWINLADDKAMPMIIRK